MLLNGEEIKGRGLIDGLRTDKITAASYTLTVGTIIGPDGEDVEDDHYLLEPQAMVVVVSAERVNLSTDVIGYVMPTVSLQNKGIYALNTGILDPGYNGLTSNMLINFGSETYPLKKRDSFSRVTFHKMNDLDSETTIVPLPRRLRLDDDKYLDARKKMARKLPNTFLNIPNLSKEIAERTADARSDEQERMLREIDNKQREIVEDARRVQQEAADTSHRRNQDLLSGAAIWIAVVVTGLTLLITLAVFFLTPLASEISTQRVSENAASELRAEDLPQMQEEIEQLEGRVEELESR